MPREILKVNHFGICQDNSGTFPSEVIYCIFLVEDWIT